jgi:alkylhydroperoxidase/carboxymuconolactone decarboxylase family protein YurZ
VEAFWAVPFADGPLTTKVKELVCLAIYASASTLHADGIAAHVRRALRAGASEKEVIEVLVAIAPLGVHAFSVGIPILMEEMKDAGLEADAELPPISDEMEAIKQDFIRSRGYWTHQREQLARLVPEFCKAYMKLSYEPWKSGVLDAKTRELVYIAIDCSVTHMYEYGLRIHIRNALKHDATRDEIMQVYELAATLGANSYVMGAKSLLQQSRP